MNAVEFNNLKHRKVLNINKKVSPDLFL